MTDSYEAYPTGETQQAAGRPAPAETTISLVPDEINRPETILDATTDVLPQTPGLEPIHTSPESFTQEYGFRARAKPLGAYQLVVLKELAETADAVEISALTKNIVQLRQRKACDKDTKRTIEGFTQRGLVKLEGDKVTFTERGRQCFVDYEVCYGEISDEAPEQFQFDTSYRIADAIILTLQSLYGEDVDIESQWVAAQNKKIDVIGWFKQELGLTEKTVRHNLNLMSRRSNPYIELQAQVINNETKPTNIRMTSDGVKLREITQAKLIKRGKILDPKAVLLASETLASCIILAKELGRDELAEQLNDRGDEDGSPILGMTKREFRDFSTEVAELLDELRLECVVSQINTRVETCIDLATKLGKNDVVQKLTEERTAREEFGMLEGMIREYAAYLTGLVRQLSAEFERTASMQIRSQAGHLAIRRAS